MRVHIVDNTRVARWEMPTLCGVTINLTTAQWCRFWYYQAYPREKQYCPECEEKSVILKLAEITL